MNLFGKRHLRLQSGILVPPSRVSLSKIGVLDSGASTKKPLLSDSPMTTLPTIVHAPYFEKPSKASKPTGISTDDPDALIKLASKLQGLENKVFDMKRANEYVRAGDIASLRKFGYSDEGIEALFNKADDTEDGYTKSDFSKIHASIRRTKKRIAELNELAGHKTKTENTSRYTYTECMKTSRIIFSFVSKPQVWVRELMLRHGFRYTKASNTWQRMLTKNAIFSANFLRKELDKENVSFFE